jgi:imidazolonepropionase-like amidohydrolase
MRPILAALLACFSLAAFAEPIAITHVTIVDAATGALQRDATVVIDGTRITAVGAVAVPKGSKVVDGRGKFLIPGLWDMHVHLSWTTSSALPLLVANGVTGVRDLGGHLPEIDGWRARIEAGTLVGPRIIRVGPILNAKSFNKYQYVLGTADESRTAARLLKFLGVDFLKVHRRTERESYLALVDEAKKLGIQVVGHIPMTVAPGEASDAGQFTIEHVATLFEGTFSTALGEKPMVPAMQEWRAKEADALFARFVKNGTIFDPTLFAYFPPPPPPASDVDSPYVAKSLKAVAATRPAMTDAERASHRAVYDEFREVVRAANRAGVMMIAGSDIADVRIPGITLHQELAALVECGLTPLQALQTATINSAKAVHREAESGTIEAGKAADLVLLDANPLEDIHNTTRIAAVVANGKLFRRAELDALLELTKKLAAEN